MINIFGLNFKKKSLLITYYTPIRVQTYKEVFLFKSKFCRYYNVPSRLLHVLPISFFNQ